MTPSPAPEKTDVLIVGGGLAGVFTLYELATRGVDALLLEAGDEVATAGASFANGAMITPSMADPWNSPGIAPHLLASIFDPTAPMRLHLSQVPDLSLWGLEFLRNSAPARHRAITRANFELAQASTRRTLEIARAIGHGLEGGGRGTMKVFQSEAAMRAPLAIARDLEPLGLEYDVLDRQAAIALEPALAAGAERLAGAIYYPGDRFGDARAFTLSLAEAARRAGGRLRSNTLVRALNRTGAGFSAVTDAGVIEARRVVLAAGVETTDFARRFGVRLPIRPAKGYSMTLDTSGLNDRPVISIADDARHIAATPLGDRLRVVGMAEFVGRDRTLDPRRLDMLFAMVEQLYPSVAARLDRTTATTWTGLRPMSADGRPFIGETKVPGLWINAGHGHLGWTKAAGSAELLADLLTGATPAIPAAPFAISRRTVASA